MKYPLIKDLTALIIDVKKRIDDNDQIDNDHPYPGLILTVGWTPEDGSWNYQTGDNSFTGGAYLHPVWAVVDVFRRSNSRELAREVIDQLKQSQW